MYNPLEQFELFSLFNINGFYITNSCFFMIFVLYFIYIFTKIVYKDIRSFIPTATQYFFENLYKVSFGLVFTNIGTQGLVYFPLILVLFSFLFFTNLVGMVPYSFTVASHLSITFGLALIMFLGINIICIKKFGIKFFNLFLPPGTSLILALLIIPIELVSYIFRVISLPVRLFANMMAGHTLLKVIAGFAWTMMCSEGLLFVAHFIPLFLLVLLIGLEFGVAMVQAYVFTILTCMYLNDAIHLH